MLLSSDNGVRAAEGEHLDGFGSEGGVLKGHVAVEGGLLLSPKSGGDGPWYLVGLLLDKHLFVGRGLIRLRTAAAHEVVQRGAVGD
jgi:hypothetical protein